MKTVSRPTGMMVLSLVVAGLLLVGCSEPAACPQDSGLTTLIVDATAYDGPGSWTEVCLSHDDWNSSLCNAKDSPGEVSTSFRGNGPRKWSYSATWNRGPAYVESRGGDVFAICGQTVRVVVGPDS